MAQQPNIELEDSDRPRSVLEPGPARRWTPSMRPGVISSPSEMPHGDGFGTPGPDAGFAITIVRRSDLEDESPEFEAVLAAIMVARASAFGRAPTEGDLKVALAMCGIGADFPEWVHVRREHWKHAIAHDKPPGRTAVSELDRELLLENPDRIRSIFKLQA